MDNDFEILGASFPREVEMFLYTLSLYHIFDPDPFWDCDNTLDALLDEEEDDPLAIRT